LFIIGRQENKWLREKQERFKKGKKRRLDKDSKDQEDLLEPWEREWNAYQHTDYWRKNHPDYSKYQAEFTKIDYTQKPARLWKKQYYEMFFGIDYDDKRALNQICFQYLKSWFYCLYYYLDEVPSWGWYYPHSASPLASDIAFTVRRIKDVNKVFKFDKGYPFKPLDQLMLVVPKKSAKDGGFLSQKWIKVMDKFPQYYPEKFGLDVLWGQKYIYSEPNLPNINAMEVLGETHKLKLTAREKRLNQLNDEPLYYGID
jgi:5'-3' exonuclease